MAQAKKFKGSVSITATIAVKSIATWLENTRCSARNFSLLKSFSWILELKKHYLISSRREELKVHNIKNNFSCKGNVFCYIAIKNTGRPREHAPGPSKSADFCFQKSLFMFFFCYFSFIKFFHITFAASSRNQIFVKSFELWWSRVMFAGS